MINQIRIPRFIFQSRNITKVEIHCFSNASQSTFDGGVYLRVQDYNEISVNLVASKTIVAPAKKIALPHLDLLGALLVAQLESELKV